MANPDLSVWVCTGDGDLVAEVKASAKIRSVDDLLHSGETWTIE